MKMIEWEDLSKDGKCQGYWVVAPKNKDSILDGYEIVEVVYVYFDGKWSVMRCGQKEREPLNNFKYIRMINFTSEELDEEIPYISSEHLQKLAETHPPDQSWYDEDHEGLFEEKQ